MAEVSDESTWSASLRKHCIHLRVGITIANILPALQPLLTPTEYSCAAGKDSNADSVDALVEFLLTKDKSTFERFCCILETNGYSHWASKLRGEGAECKTSTEVATEETSTPEATARVDHGFSGAADKGMTCHAAIVRKTVLDRLRRYQKRTLEASTFGVLVVGTPGSGKSTLIQNLFGVEFKGKQGEIKCLSIAVDGVSVTLYISYGIGKDSKHHLRQLQRLIRDEVISLIIYCFPVNDTRLRPEPFETIQRYSIAGVDWSRAVLALTFSDRLVAPKHEREHKDSSERSLFERMQEWTEGIKTKLSNGVKKTKGTEDAIHVHPTTEDKEGCLPDGREWYGPLWERIEALIAT